jgi:enoyl-CoA hydratase
MTAVEEEAPVRAERVGGVLVITIDRPGARNAIDTRTAEHLAEAMDLLDEDPTLIAGVLTGAGGTFCAGMDLKAFLRGERPSIGARGFAGFVEQPPEKPLIAAVEGYALAGGFEMVLACDLIVAARDAEFGLPEVQRGLVAAAGGLMRLPARVPYHQAMQWALTGERVPAYRAAELGLINRLTDRGGALAAALDLATTISGNGPLAVRATKRVITSASDWTTADAFHRQREITEPVRASGDAQEGARAFAEKRAPRWQGV